MKDILAGSNGISYSDFDRIRKMKIAVCSDIHLEFGPITLENTGGADVLVLSGDICVADDLRTPDPYGIMDSAKLGRFYEFFKAASENFKDVVYIMGNHEHYHGDYAKTADTLRGFLMQSDYTNVHFLDKEFVELNGYIFYGGTMWTNFDIGYGPGDHSAMRHIKGIMNDYRGVKNSNRMVTYSTPVYKTDENGVYVTEKNQYGYDAYVEIGMKKNERVAKFSPEDSYEDHCAYMEQLIKVLNSTELPVIVVGHHAPSKQSTHPRYKNETMINTAYSSDLTSFILDHPQIKVWTHGHTHEPFDYMIGTTRIVCNPRGYDGYEQRAADFELKFIEV